MSNILYIIIGLVVVVLVVVLVLRNSKAKNAPAQPVKPARTAAVANTAIKSQTVSAEQNATKFDPLTVAQRFIDQQRYDKAIETLERGLEKQPQDATLLLKLLNIYAITDQTDDFDKIYSAIKNNGDAATINDADQLKALLEQEQTHSQPVQSETATDSSFDGLDFDLSTAQTATEHKPTQTENDLDHNLVDLESQNTPAPSVPEANNDFVIDISADDDFDLTLDDLESTDTDGQVDTSTPVTTTDNNDNELSFEDNSDDEATTRKNLNVDDDFTLSFDDLSQDLEVQEVQEVQETIEPENHEDFALLLEEDSTALESSTADFDSTLIDENEDDVQSEDNTQLSDSISLESNTADSFDNNLLSLDELNVDNELTIEDDTQSTLNDEASNVAYLDENDGENTDTVRPTIDTTADNTIAEHAPVANEFETDTSFTASTAITPVDDADDFKFIDEDRSGSNDQNANDQSLVATPTEDFAAQFAADFDFVNTLDANQVTLDLAGQYLELGEYDSAARLLSEVIAEGSSEQQDQAQEMLARTA
ncbi:FimV/HubP family polar landmark protein [uncultured Psychrobacter sp.]|uniref:FimV/HubP family polar landmark protein n=1 Tax=uncultured Psychrobacter sp. TaxID=259303 RepID=UPI0034590465